jgi:hypothetical protein
MLSRRHPPGEFIFDLLKKMAPPDDVPPTDQEPISNRVVYLLLVLAGVAFLIFGFLVTPFSK